MAMLVVRMGVTIKGQKERNLCGDRIFLYLDCSHAYRNLYICD